MGEQILTKRNSKDIFHADGKLSQMESQLKERMKKKGKYVGKCRHS